MKFTQIYQAGWELCIREGRGIAVRLRKDEIHWTMKVGLPILKSHFPSIRIDFHNLPPSLALLHVLPKCYGEKI